MVYALLLGKGMPLLLAVVLLHEYILKTFLPRYKLKAEAFEASNHFVECWFRKMAQEELNRNDIYLFIYLYIILRGLHI